MKKAQNIVWKITFISFVLLACNLIFNLKKNGASKEHLKDEMIASYFSVKVLEKDGTIVAILSTTNGISQVRVSYGDKKYETYAISPLPVTNGQPVKVVHVTNRNSEIIGVQPTFTQLVIPY